MYQIHESPSVYMSVTLPVYSCSLLLFVNPLTYTIPQYENVDVITNALPTTELEMNTCAVYVWCDKILVVCVIIPNMTILNFLCQRQQNTD